MTASFPAEPRERLLKELNRDFGGSYPLSVDGDLCPFCRRTFTEYLRQSKGDWQEVIRHVKVRRLMVSEKDRVGIGTFQPKDEKNQDSTELTGDINYRKIAEFVGRRSLHFYFDMWNRNLYPIQPGQALNSVN